MIRCACVASYMGPYISNYILSELALQRKFSSSGNYIIHIFPKEVEDKDWVKLFRNEGAKLYFIDYRPRTLWTVKTFRRIFKDENINVLHCHFGGWDMDAKFAAPFTPTVWHQRMSVNLKTLKQRVFNNLMYKVIGRYNTQHISISQPGYDAIKSLTNVPTHLIYDGIEFSRLRKKTEFFRGKQQNLPIKILMFAFSAIGKGLDVAIPACQKLINRGEKIELRVVTQANSNKYLAENYPALPSWIKILQPTSNVFEYYNSCDIFLSASRSEGFCNSLLEAIYSGMPCIESDIPGTQWARKFNNTYEYKTESSDDLADKIVECINTNLTEENVIKNRELAEYVFSMDNWTESVFKVLSDNHKE